MKLNEEIPNFDAKASKKIYSSSMYSTDEMRFPKHGLLLDSKMRTPNFIWFPSSSASLGDESLSSNASLEIDNIPSSSGQVLASEKPSMEARDDHLSKIAGAHISLDDVKKGKMKDRIVAGAFQFGQTDCYKSTNSSRPEIYESKEETEPSYRSMERKVIFPASSSVEEFSCREKTENDLSSVVYEEFQNSNGKQPNSNSSYCFVQQLFACSDSDIPESVSRFVSQIASTSKESHSEQQRRHEFVGVAKERFSLVLENSKDRLSRALQDFKNIDTENTKRRFYQTLQGFQNVDANAAFRCGKDTSKDNAKVVLSNVDFIQDNGRYSDTDRDKKQKEKRKPPHEIFTVPNLLHHSNASISSIEDFPGYPIDFQSIPDDLNTIPNLLAKQDSDMEDIEHFLAAVVIVDDNTSIFAIESSSSSVEVEALVDTDHAKKVKNLKSVPRRRSRASSTRHDQLVKSRQKRLIRLTSVAITSKTMQGNRF